jgi:hypothetical protein
MAQVICAVLWFGIALCVMSGAQDKFRLYRDTGTRKHQIVGIAAWVGAIFLALDALKFLVK